MCFGNDDSPPAPPQLQAPPPIQPMMDFINHVAGVKTIEATGPNGKKIVEVVRLPRSPEEQRFFDEIAQTFQETFRNIKTLVSQNPETIPDFMPFFGQISALSEDMTRDLAAVSGLPTVENDVKYFKDLSTRYVEENFQKRTQELEDHLAMRGLSNSSEGDKMRQELRQDFNRAIMDNDWRALQYSEALGAQKFQTRMAGFKARQEGRMNQAAVAETGLNLQRQNYQDKLAQRTGKLQDLSFLGQTAGNIENTDYQKAVGANTEGNAMARYTADNTFQMNRYNADIDRQYRQYNMNLGQWQAEQSQPDFVSTALNLGTTLGTSYLAGMGAGSGNTLYQKGFNRGLNQIKPH